MSQARRSVADSLFLRACRGEPTEYTPVWLNRQAGRYMPEYRKLKGDTPSLQFFKSPELASKAAVDAQRILGVDAAIVFADLLPILEVFGLSLDYIANVGPVIANPLRAARDFKGIELAPVEEECAYIAETIRRTIADLPRDIPLIGFAGAPFTLASYAIEGRTSRDFVATKRLMATERNVWNWFMSNLTETVASYVELQIDAGADAIQIFDSWVGCLSADDYTEFVAPATRELMSKIAGQVPIIYFGTGNTHLIDAMYATGPDFMALDWRTPLVETWDRLNTPAIQGNLDPAILCSDQETIKHRTEQLLRSVNRRPGHIFNLGHGIVPQTPVGNVKRLVDVVHGFQAD